MKNENAPLSALETNTCTHLFNKLSFLNDPLFRRNVAEMMIEKGYATVVRHRRDDEDRSSDYDKLMAAEQMYELFS